MVAGPPGDAASAAVVVRHEVSCSGGLHVGVGRKVCKCECIETGRVGGIREEEKQMGGGQRDVTEGNVETRKRQGQHMKQQQEIT